MGRSLAAYAHWVQYRDARSLQTIADTTSWNGPCERGQHISLNHDWLVDAQVITGGLTRARHCTARALMRSRECDSCGETMANWAVSRASAVGVAAESGNAWIAQSVLCGRAGAGRATRWPCLTSVERKS